MTEVNAEIDAVEKCMMLFESADISESMMDRLDVMM